MKKIAIMTWFRYANYGSVLQAYALGTYLKNKGFEVTYIDYIPNKSFSKPLVKLLLSRELLLKIKDFFYNRRELINEDLKKREVLFNDFVNNNFKVSISCETNSELSILANKFDIIICGSDQIWSPIVFDEKYFLTYTKNKKVKTIAYAPSFGMPQIRDKNVKERIADALGELDFISVREDSGVEIINQLGKKAQVVVDPTLLLTKDLWEKLSKPYEKTPLKPYILFYLLGNNKFYNKYIDWCIKNDFEVLIIPCHNYDYKRKGTIANSVKPENFLSLIKNAAGVCTDSFHGTVFSILYNKPFISLARFKESDNISQNERLHTLLKLIGEENRFVDKFSFSKAEMLYKKIESSIELKRRIEESYSFLNQALNTELKKKSRIENITQNCSGCGVCSSICPTKSIKIEKNEYGFYNAIIDLKTCINCKLCEKICGFNSSYNLNLISNSEIYAVRTKENKILMESSSGAFATNLSLLLNKEEYKIIGCSYDYITNEAEHIIATNKKEILSLAGSKYLQSHIDRILPLIDDKSKYLFIGTPCQVASLNNLLLEKGIRERFILIDLICHGVPSYNLWKKYIKYISSKYLNKEKIIEVSFRKKIDNFTNNNMNMFIKTKNKTFVCKQEKDLFFKFFCLGNVYAESCYNCNYRTKSAADIRIGDYWGEKYKNISGTSMVILLTSRGKKVFNLYKKYFNIEKGLLEDYKNYQQNKNINPPNYYNVLMNELSKNNLIEVYKNFCKQYYVLEPLKKVIKKCLKIKKF